MSTIDEARTAGRAAGRALKPAIANPYNFHVPAWKARDGATAGDGTPELAAAWRDGYRDGQAAYAESRGLTLGDA